MSQSSPPIESDVLFASASASVQFALSCLEPVGPHLRARSSFVDPQGRTMHWHDFGDLEGPGWAANAVGGAHLLYRWGRYVRDDEICQRALQLVDHVLHDGFIRSDGLVWPYWDLAEARFCLNYAHTNDWLCPGSLAKIGVQMWDLAVHLGETSRAEQLRSVARALGDWLETHAPLLANGWIPRRVTPTGEPYKLTPEGGIDSTFDHSADGLFLLALWSRLGRKDKALRLADTFVEAGGFWGSINHDTYDDHENVAYAVAFDVLRAVADRWSQPDLRAFAYEAALPAMRRFRMNEHRHGVFTKGLSWMEASWDTAYLWENAEVAQAHLDAWREREDAEALQVALAALRAMAHHHEGPLGFLTEGIDWNNHVSQRHHIDFAYYGAIRYTEPLLNNLHLVGPTLTYLQAMDAEPPEDRSLASNLRVLSCLSSVSPEVTELEAEDMKVWLRLYHPPLADDESVDSILAFAREAEIDGVLLFEASYDTDPALLPLDVLAGRFERLKTLVPRFRAAGLAVHVNVMITMGHVDDGGGRPETFDFQMLVDDEGRVSRSTACPLDSGFLDYVAQIYGWAAACDADAVWVDDDVRFLLHDLEAMTCFCPHHLAEMATRTGRPWTREALVNALENDAADPSVRESWFAVQSDAMAGLAVRIEHAVHDVAPKQPIGLMSVGTNVHHAEGRHTDRLLRLLTGDVKPPMLRPGSGFWHDWTPAAVIEKTEDVARQVAYLGRDVRVVAEIENHPYTPYQKSQRVMALEMALNLLAGVRDLSLNIFSGTMPFARSEVEYATFLQSQKPFLLALRQACAGKRRVGIGVETTEDVARQMKLENRSLMAWIETRPWEIALARLGLPVGGPYDAPHLLTRDAVWSDRYALNSAIQDGALLTPGAVDGLLQQGWGGRFGIRDVHRAPADVNELFTGDALNERHRGTILPVRHYGGRLGPHVFELDPGLEARVLSQWVDLAGSSQGAGVVALKTKDGTRIGLLPFEITTVAPALLQPARRDQWAALLRWVGQAPLPIRAMGGVNVYPQLLVSSDEAEVLVALTNLSADAVVADLDVPLLIAEGAGAWEMCERLGPDGRWHAMDPPHKVDIAPWSVAVLQAQRDPTTL